MLAVAVGLPVIWKYMVDNMDKCIDCRGQEYLAKIFNEIAKTMGCNTPEEVIVKFCLMMEEMELKNPVTEYRERDLEVLSTSVNPVRLKNNPIRLEPEAIYSLYDKIVL